MCVQFISNDAPAQPHQGGTDGHRILREAWSCLPDEAGLDSICRHCPVTDLFAIVLRLLTLENTGDIILQAAY